MKIPAFLPKVVEFSGNTARKSWQKIVHCTGILRGYASGQGLGLAKRYVLAAKGFWLTVWARLKVYFFRGQNILSSRLIHLRVLYQSSRHYRSVVFMSMSALALSLFLALLFLFEPPESDEARAATGSGQSSDVVSEESLDSENTDADEFPADIFSNETLPTELVQPPAPPVAISPAQAPSAPDTAPNLDPAPAPTPATNASGTDATSLTTDAANRDKIRQEALEELSQNYRALSAEIESLREKEKSRQAQNERNRQLLDQYEKEIEILRRQLKESQPN